MKESLLQLFKSQDMVEFLAKLNIHPKKISNGNYWYISPIRQPLERSVSFKISKGNTGIFLFWDYATGEHGNLVDFCCLYYGITPKELFDKLRNDEFSFFVQHPKVQKEAGQKEKSSPNTALVTPIMTVKTIKEICHPALIRYLKQDRKIDLEIAKLYCKEVHYKIGNMLFFAIGFPNVSQGFELRSSIFKGTMSPKNYTLFSRGHNTVNLFEGFMDFVSYQQLVCRQIKVHQILRSVFCFES